VKVSRVIKVLHIIFVDDILIMTKDSLVEWMVIKSLLDLSCCASGIKVNLNKSTVHHSGIQGEVLEKIKEAFTFTFVEMSEGFIYLRYFIKA